MINRFLMELYDKYVETNDVNCIIDFAKKTFPSDGTEKLFVGCVLILFSNAICFKPRYFCTRENLLSVVLLTKEKIGDTNYLDFYIEHVNKEKGISSYLRDIVKSPDLDRYSDLIIDYLEQFKFDLLSNIKKMNCYRSYLNNLK